MSDDYTKETTSYVRKGGTRTMSESVSYIGKGEDELDAILNHIGREVGSRNLWIQLKEPFPIPNFFDADGNQVVYWPDVILHGEMFGDGIIRVQGGIHRTHKHQLRDPIQKERMESTGYWVEDLSPSEAKQESVVRERLERHRRKVDGYGGKM